MSHVCGQYQDIGYKNNPVRVVFTVIPASICTHSAKLDAVLMLLCLKNRFSMLDTYFYKKIKFLYARIKDARFPVIGNRKSFIIVAWLMCHMSITILSIVNCIF